MQKIQRNALHRQVIAALCACGDASYPWAPTAALPCLRLIRRFQLAISEIQVG